MNEKTEEIADKPELPQGQQPMLPTFQVQLPIPTQPTPVPRVQLLVNAIQEFTREGNSSEERVALQIILIASAIVAIVGGFALSDNATHIGIPTGILLIFAAVGLGVSLIAGVLHFVTERRFWYKNREKANDSLKVIQKVSNPQDQENAALQALADINEGSSRLAFWVQISSFIVGVLALLILIIATIVSKAK